MENKKGASLLKIILVVLFGWTGWQRFATKKYVSGTIFLLTLGLLGVGWVLDAISIIKNNEIKFFNL